MRIIRLLFGIAVGCLLLSVVSYSIAGDYNQRFVRNYPPGFNGMWYYAERFIEPERTDPMVNERYRWDKFMSRITELSFPFWPIPYDWEYGTTRSDPVYGTARAFNLPDYNRNDWW